MKLKFFGQDKALPEPLCIYILSFAFAESDIKNFSLVNKAWQSVVQKTKSNLSLLPTLQRIPQIARRHLGQMDIQPMSGGMTNRTFKIGINRIKINQGKVDVIEDHWVLRVPGQGSSIFINRGDEAYNAKQAQALSLNVTIDFFDPEDGLQLSRYLENNRTLTKELQRNPMILQGVAVVLKRLHQSAPFQNTVNMFSRNETLLKKLKESHAQILPAEVELIETTMKQLQALVNRYKIEMQPCHNDTTPENFLIAPVFTGKKQEDEVKLLDWEYSANNDFLVGDLVTLIRLAELSKEQESILIRSYFGHENEAISAWVELYKPVVEWWVAIWSWTQLGNHANACDLSAYEKLAYSSYCNTKTLLEQETFKQACTFIENDSSAPTFTGARIL
ncbi:MULTISPECIES: choline/ethanolamine kinase family protein [unclassified Legionella]|uniref:choline/ethanolamine kinase family protein n=1 Tax=unclassified Legionella TaxID=2622702 RepID=UPI0010559245|nr:MULTISPECIES: choline/ethanolamine kinase family protein [unclassified Legionella]MDI9818983.1 choline/ethanolamine kinase family protein [Legionella sp. PL877]